MTMRIWPVFFMMLLCGCAMFEVPTMESISRKSNEAAVSNVLTHPSPRVRAEAAEDLGRKGDQESVALLRQALRDPEPVVREAAAAALRESGDPGKVAEPDVIQALQAESNPAAAVAMGWTLQRWKSDVRPGLDALMKVVNQRDDALSRYHAALIIRGVVGAEVVAPVYVDTLGTKIARDARNKPDELLSDLIPEHASIVLPFLVAGSTNDNPEARAAIARMLYKFKPRPNAMEITRRLIENPAADVSRSVLPPDAESLLLALMSDSSGNVRAAAAWSAGMCEPAPDAAGPLLLRALEDQDAAVRAAAVNSLGPLVALQRAPTGSYSAMEKLLIDSSAEVRAETALAFAHLGDLTPEITRVLSGRVDAAVETDAQARAMAANALGRGADIPELHAAFRRGIRDANETVVERTLASIGQRGIAEPDLLAEIAARTAAVNSKGIRFAAFGAVRDLGPLASSVQSQVIMAQSDADADIREAASVALSRINEK